MTIGVKIWGLGAGVAALMVVGGTVLLGVQPALAAADSANAAADAAAAQNATSSATLQALSTGNAKLSTMQAQEKVLLKSVPRILKPNTFVRRVGEVAAIDDVTVDEVTPGDSVGYTPPESAGGKTADGTVAPPQLAKVDPLISGANFTVVPMEVQVSGTSSAVMQFAHDIQIDQRLFAVNSLTTSTAEDGSVGATLAGYVYTLQR